MKMTTMIVATSLALLACGAAQAMPVAPVAQSDASVTLVRGGCGFGEHRGPAGGCRLNRGPRGAIRRSITGAPRGCPPWMVRGPRGFCHR
ncbi:GCG_CRPN prefix-to-repeats domain-containing protein [Methylobacterium radiotolerans]|uniref:GCG_CRPN prefix-to-repeats domain-containing protein n=1 Tax=Methylobacterium radiotolerans TaxID=31998 RepID=UPI00399CE575